MVDQVPHNDEGRRLGVASRTEDSWRRKNDELSFVLHSSKVQEARHHLPRIGRHLDLHAIPTILPPDRSTLYSFLHRVANQHSRRVRFGRVGSQHRVSSLLSRVRRLAPVGAGRMHRFIR